MPFVGLGLHLLVAIFFAIHVFKTGRPMYWLGILFSFPLLGSIVYFFVEYAPDMRNTRGGRKVIKTIDGMIDPNRALRETKADFDRAQTVEHRFAYAEVLGANHRYAEALEHLNVCASGSYANDAKFVRAIANTELLTENWQSASRGYERLFALENVARTPDDDLGYAFSLSKCDDPRANDAFQQALKSSKDPIARCRYAEYLIDTQRKREAREALDEVIREGQLAPPHTKEMFKGWYALASTLRARAEA